MFNNVDKFIIKNLHIRSLTTQKEFKLYIFVLHSTDTIDFERYRFILKYINKIAPFLDPSNLDKFTNAKKLTQQRSILTLDDGFNNNYQFSTEVLDPLGIKAIFFVVPYYLENKYQHSDFYYSLFPKMELPSNDILKEKFKHLTLEQVMLLHNNNHTICVHGYNHESAANISQKALSINTIKSLKFITKHIPFVNHYCYPFGSYMDFNQQTHDYLRAKFRFLHLGIRGVNSIKDINDGILKRHPISELEQKSFRYLPYSPNEIYFYAFNRSARIPLIIYHQIKKFFQTFMSKNF